MTAELDCLSGPWWNLLSRYRVASPAEQKEMRDACFRAWALRSDDDPYGMLAGATYDEMERLRRVAKAQKT
ncbi:MAG: hypothetical protein WA864_28295 [Acetobacteraceae bacterium]|jgi:hypothetical protein